MYTHLACKCNVLHEEREVRERPDITGIEVRDGDLGVVLHGRESRSFPSVVETVVNDHRVGAATPAAC
jgi:hypothetical protein